MRYFLLLILATLSFAGETALPPNVDSYEQEASKAYATYLQATNKAAEKATKELDSKLKAAMKKGDLDLATALKTRMEDIAKGKTLTTLENAWKSEAPNLLGGPQKLEGTWEMTINGKPSGVISFKDDGKVVNPWKENWTVETKDKKTTINTANSGMKNITLTDIQSDTMKGASGINQTIELKRKAE
jgi:hypothetical protein